MKKHICIMLSLLFCITFSLSITAAAIDSSGQTVEDVVEQIKTTLSDEDAHSWSQMQDAVFDYDYILPVYSTDNVSQESETLLETLTFMNAYNLPIVTASGDCIGVAKVIFHNDEWKIGAYISGLDLISAMDQLDSSVFYYVEIPQLSGDFGFLTISTSGERYNSLASQIATINDQSGIDVLSLIKSSQAMNSENAEGTGAIVRKNSNYSLALLAGVIVLLAFFGTAYIVIQHKKRRNSKQS